MLDGLIRNKKRSRSRTRTTNNNNLNKFISYPMLIRPRIFWIAVFYTTARPPEQLDSFPSRCPIVTFRTETRLTAPTKQNLP